VADITPDGSKLLISGTVSIETAPKGRERTWKDRPTGLVVVDTEKMEVVFREETASDFKLSPDGRWLLASRSYFDEDRPGERGVNGAQVGFGLKIIDLGSFQVVRHLWPDTDVYVTAISGDSRFAYVTAEGPGMKEARRTTSKCTADCTSVSVVDSETAQVLTERLLGPDFGIISIAPDR
jgi:hypothetical protein